MTTTPHLNDEKNGAFWLQREFIMDAEGEVGLFFILFCIRLQSWTKPGAHDLGS